MFVSTREMLNQLGDAPVPGRKPAAEKCSRADLAAILSSLESNCLDRESLLRLAAAVQKAQIVVPEGAVSYSGR